MIKSPTNNLPSEIQVAITDYEASKKAVEPHTGMPYSVITALPLNLVTGKSKAEIDALLNAEALQSTYLDRLKLNHPQLAVKSPERLEAEANSITDQTIASRIKAIKQAKLQSELLADLNDEATPFEDKLIKAGEIERLKIQHERLASESKKADQPVVLGFRQVLDIVERYVITAKIGDSEGDFDTSPVYFYDPQDGVYKPLQSRLRRYGGLVEPSMTSRQTNDYMNRLRDESPERHLTRNKNLLLVGNGIYDLKNKQLKPYSPKYVFTSRVSVNYNSEAKEPDFGGWRVSNWFDEIADNDPVKFKLIWQVIAGAVNASRNLKKVFVLTDKNNEGGSGKSTFLTLLKNLVGHENVAELRFSEIDPNGNRVAYELEKAVGKALIAGDENSPKIYLEKSDNLKSMSMGQGITVNPKGKTPFAYDCNALIIQCINGLPTFGDFNNALKRRLIFIRFNHRYAETTEDNPHVIDDYINNPRLLEWILKEALKVDLDTIVETEESKAIKGELTEDSDPVYRFVENYLDGMTSTKLPVAFLFDYFRYVSLKENNLTKLSQQRFIRRIKPFMLNHGWQYSNGSKRLDGGFTIHDWKLIKEWRMPGHAISYDFDRGYTVDTRNISMFYK